ncbi:hypothetical protein [Ketogulonicigenium vulgare]|uniref:Uncharacterized protein n=1 Tax=Ketogulonicigenium vulgare (strain WSH-001) TaxID=759362 RepID=F9Y8X2_KETVW|nr:hypothetical protein [Ketogulonicigenium vulgare]ADO41797.1 hypothetical protein EIO_0637 [Ketogulonicigenium vulgare Y25]AEM40028.1 hypothetical protein KVU_0189 [Ketogulonicigenium vulgare WSH-001]ALJ80233.1 hypothetical protein KVH_03010 [Ketogulonicigenium vulgare]AOZ53727.1 hypothetical protein KVC_0703 [Ketogulonicigenium vulgare]
MISLLPSGAEIGIAAVKALACGIAVWAMVKSVDGAPPPVVAMVIGLPVVFAAGYLAMAGVVGPDFLIEVGLRSAQTMPAVLTFIVVTGRFYNRLPLPALLGVSLAAWLVVAWTLSGGAEPWPLPASLSFGVAALLLSHLVFPINARFPISARVQRPGSGAWRVALQAAAMVLLLTVVSRLIGPRGSAVLVALPLAMIFLTIGMKSSGTLNAAATYQSARLAMPGLVAYVASFALLTPFTGGLAACFLAFLPSLAVSGAVVGLRLYLTPKETT